MTPATASRPTFVGAAVLGAALLAAHVAAGCAPAACAEDADCAPAVCLVGAAGARCVAPSPVAAPPFAQAPAQRARGPIVVVDAWTGPAPRADGERVRARPGRAVVRARIDTR